MKTLINIVVFVVTLTAGIVSAQAQERTITATVVNATSDAGKVGFALYNKQNFMKQPLQAKNAKIEGGKSKVVFENIPAGEYAIICYHDKNDNDKMDFSPNGMPAEDYGTSNNDMSFGPPQFYNAKFTVADKDVSLEIKF